MSENTPEQPAAPAAGPDQTEVPLADEQQADQPHPTQASEEGTDDEEAELPDAGPASGPTETPYVQQVVDKTPNAATERDEEDVLRELYGEPDEHGFYTAEGSGTEEEDPPELDTDGKG